METQDSHKAPRQIFAFTIKNCSAQLKPGFNLQAPACVTPLSDSLQHCLVLFFTQVLETAKTTL